MQMNMMCARREFKNAQERFDHMTMVIKSYIDNGEVVRRESLPYIQERKGNPFAAMQNISMRFEGYMAGAWIFNKDLQTFKKLAYAYSKLSILKSVEYSNPMPFFFVRTISMSKNQCFIC